MPQIYFSFKATISTVTTINFYLPYKPPNDQDMIYITTYSSQNVPNNIHSSIQNMFRQLNRQSQEEFENHQWGDQKSNRVIEMVAKHIEIVSEITKSAHPGLVEVCTNAKHLMIQLKYNLNYVKKASLEKEGATEKEKPKDDPEGIVNELEKMRRQSVNRFLSQFNEKQSRKQTVLIPGSLNYHLKYQSKEIQTNLLECQVQTMINRLKNYEAEWRMITQLNESLVKQNEEKKLELLSLNKSLMGILMEKAILEAQFVKFKQLKPSIVEKIVIDYSQIEKRVNQGYQSIIQNVIKYSAQNIFTKQAEYTSMSVPSTNKKRLKCVTVSNMMVLPKSKQNLDILNQYYSNFQKNSLTVNETENLIKSLQTKETKIYELERKVAQMESSMREKNLKILKERVMKKVKGVVQYDDKEVQTFVVLGMNEKVPKEQLRKFGYVENGDGVDGGSRRNLGGREGNLREVDTEREQSMKKSMNRSKYLDNQQNLLNEEQQLSQLNKSKSRTAHSKKGRKNNLHDRSQRLSQEANEAINSTEQDKTKNAVDKRKQGNGRKKSITKTNSLIPSQGRQAVRNRRTSRKDRQQSMTQVVSSNKAESSLSTAQKGKEDEASLVRMEWKGKELGQLGDVRFKSKYTSLKDDINDLEFRAKHIQNELNSDESSLALNRSSNYSSKKRIKKTVRSQFRLEDNENKSLNIQLDNLEDERSNTKTVSALEYDNQPTGQTQTYQHNPKGNSEKSPLIKNGYRQTNQTYSKTTKQSILTKTDFVPRGIDAIQNSTYVLKQSTKQNAKNRIIRLKNTSEYQKQGDNQPPLNLQQIRKRIESLPVLEQTKSGDKQNIKSLILPKLQKCQHQHQHDKMTHLQSKKIQDKIEKLQEEIIKAGKGRANNSKIELHKYMKLLETLHKTCGSDCKYLQRAWQSSYAVPQNKRQLRIPKYDLVYGEEQEE